MRKTLTLLALAACSLSKCLAQGPSAVARTKDLEYIPGFPLENGTGARDRLAQLGQKYFDDALMRRMMRRPDLTTAPLCVKRDSLGGEKVYMGGDSKTPQINISKIPGGTGVAGALFAIGSMLIFLFGVPRIRYFFIGAIVLGCVIALGLRFVRRETPGKPWILPASQEADNNVLPAGPADSNGRPGDRSNLQALMPA